MQHHASQFLLKLTQTVTVERGISLVCIPDRFAAENELTRLRAKFGPNLIKADIRKDKPSMAGGRKGKSPGTYTTSPSVGIVRHTKLPAGGRPRRLRAAVRQGSALDPPEDRHPLDSRSLSGKRRLTSPQAPRRHVPC